MIASQECVVVCSMLVGAWAPNTVVRILCHVLNGVLHIYAQLFPPGYFGHLVVWVWS
jgi:hypothetical protein